MYIQNTHKRISLALMGVALLGACKQPKNAATLRKHGNQKIIAGSVVGATEHKKAKKLAAQERLAELEKFNETKRWHNQPLELESIS